MWPKATKVLEECYYHWCRKRGEGGVGGVDGEEVRGGGGRKGGHVSPTFLIVGGGGGQWYVCAPHFLIFHLNYMFI